MPKTKNKKEINNKSSANIPQASSVNTDINTDNEYEYVPISQATTGIVGKVVSFLTDNIVMVAVLLLIGFAWLFNVLHLSIPSIGIIFAFIILSAVSFVMLKMAWDKRQEAKQKYEHAQAVRKAVLDQLGIDDSENNNMLGE